MSRPGYKTLIKSLKILSQLVQGEVINPLSEQEVRDSYLELRQATLRAMRLVRRFEQAESEKHGRHSTAWKAGA